VSDVQYFPLRLQTCWSRVDNRPDENKQNEAYNYNSNEITNPVNEGNFFFHLPSKSLGEEILFFYPDWNGKSRFFLNIFEISP